MSCGVGRRRGSDAAWLWLWWRPAAVAPIPPLAREPPYAAGAALKRKTKQKKLKALEGFAPGTKKLPLPEELPLIFTFFCV